MPSDVIVVGAGIVGAACAYSLAAAGLSVVVVDRAAVAAGTTGSGEGNVLVSDKGPGPELDLQLRSTELWRRYEQELPAGSFELEAKGGVTVASTDEQHEALAGLSRGQAGAGVDVRPVSPAELLELEPHLVPDVAGGVFYPQDLQVQPMRAAAQLLAAARQRGATLQLATEVLGATTSGSRLTGVVTTRGPLSAGWVVNAAGTWAQAVSESLGAPVPIQPRRGLILVTEPLPPVIRHKVYTADYVANVASSSAALQTSTVIERTLSGPVLIGSSRERVGYDRTISVPVLRQMAREAVRLFPVLARVRAIRAYAGFRPYSPDHLPVIGPDPRLDGLVHACGHEGAGIGLAPATGEMVCAVITGTPAPVAAEPFAPARFAAGG
jgi:glycine/D-amino acid oxidase-like deaminating enzyme